MRIAARVDDIDVAARVPAEAVTHQYGAGEVIGPLQQQIFEVLTCMLRSREEENDSLPFDLYDHAGREAPRALRALGLARSALLFFRGSARPAHNIEDQLPRVVGMNQLTTGCQLDEGIEHASQDSRACVD